MSCFLRTDAPPETPPREWGRVGVGVRQPVVHRNTPTDVGKICRLFQRLSECRPPHESGEDTMRSCDIHKLKETTPRCGEDQCLCLHFRQRWKHPHGRGEDAPALIASTMYPETPPQMWGRHILPDKKLELCRNTPTNVGKITCARRRTRWAGKHPHGSGEECSGLHFSGSCPETPPRERGRHLRTDCPGREVGNTPTMWGNIIPSTY